MINKIHIIDDIIDLKEQDILKEKLLGRDFNWHYLQDVSYLDGTQKRPGFSHYFILNEKINSDYNYLTHNIIVNSCMKVGIDCKKLIESRAFLQLPLHDNITKGDLIDTPHIDRETEHTVILYYVKTADGDTIIYDNDKEHKITPKQGRAVIFNGLLKHTATQPINDSRCIINVNIC
tara:strand:+ start:93 stop:623 length:531 start_codon:yes stop_codon:yes gene_type:complete